MHPAYAAAGLLHSLPFWTSKPMIWLCDVVFMKCQGHASSRPQATPTSTCSTYWCVCAVVFMKCQGHASSRPQATPTSTCSTYWCVCAVVFMKCQGHASSRLQATPTSTCSTYDCVCCSVHEVPGPRLFTPAGHAYQHVFNISLCVL